MEAVSHEKFKINHLRQRIAQMTVVHEDALADAAVEKQLLLQQRSQLQELVTERDNEIQELRDRIAELEGPSEEEPDSDPENSPEG